MDYKLTAGSINQILNGVLMHRAVIQILGCKKISGPGIDCYRLIISDGVTHCPFAVLGIHLNSLITNRLLEEFAIILLDKYVCHEVEPNCKIIILLDAMVLYSGGFVNERVENPFCSPTLKIMNPKLTSGPINQIWNNKDICKAIRQILSSEKCSAPEDFEMVLDRPRDMAPCAIRDIAPGAIISNPTYEINTSNADFNCTQYLDLSLIEERKWLEEVIQEGKKHIEELRKQNEERKQKLRKLEEMRKKENFQSMLPKLTTGSISQILNFKHASGAVMQILAYRKIPSTGIDRYRLLITDGITDCPFVMLGIQMNYLITNKELEKFTIVRVDKYVCSEAQPSQKVIILLNLTVLTPGADVGKNLCNPVNLSPASAATANENKHSNLTVLTPKEGVCVMLDTTENPSISSSNTRDETDTSNDINNECSQSMLPKLTYGSINRILNCEDASGAVMQILAYRKIPGTGIDRYRLLITDGATNCPFVMLGIQMSYLITNKELEKFTIVRVNKYVCNEVQPDRKIITLLDLTVLTPGEGVGEKLWYPENSSLSANGTDNSYGNDSKSVLTANTEPPINETDTSNNTNLKLTFSANAEPKVVPTNEAHTSNNSDSTLAFSANSKTKDLTAKVTDSSDLTILTPVVSEKSVNTENSCTILTSTSETDTSINTCYVDSIELNSLILDLLQR